MKKHPNKSIALTGLVITLLFSTSTVYGDIGPAPPSMDFVFEFQTQVTPILNGQLIHCNDYICAEGRPAIPAQLYCSEYNCYSIGIIEGYTPYQKLVITFADKSRVSHPFSRVAYSAKYLVTVNEDNLLVREVFPDSPLELFSPIQVLGFLPALILTVISETFVATLYSRRTKTPIKWVGYANVLSLPIVWFVFPFLRLGAFLIFVLAEAFAIAFEALFLYITNKKAGLSFHQASSVSLSMNLSSIAVGVLAVMLTIGVIYLLSYGYL